MAKRIAKKTPESEQQPVRTPLFRFADVGRGPVPLGSHNAIHGAD